MNLHYIIMNYNNHVIWLYHHILFDIHVHYLMSTDPISGRSQLFSFLICLFPFLYWAIKMLTCITSISSFSYHHTDQLFGKEYTSRKKPQQKIIIKKNGPSFITYNMNNFLSYLYPFHFPSFTFSWHGCGSALDQT